MVINDQIKELVHKLEQTGANDSVAFTTYLKDLISALKINLAKSENTQRYLEYKNNIGSISKYPISEDGFAIAYDPIEDEQEFWNAWQQFGIVVGKNVVAPEICARAIKRMHEITSDISDGKCDLDKSETWNNTPVDADGISFISRGFFEVYHDKALSDIRQSIRLYIHHVLIWGRVDLWTSFDRLGVKLPHHEESYALPLHVDQNPLIHPDFKTVQGVLALTDCPVERGTFVGVPGSKSIFADYGKFAPTHGEFVELQDTAEIAKTLEENAQAIPLRAGNIVSWDSRTTHANTENKSQETRFVAYVAAGPSREDAPELIQARTDAFISGIGTNVREALMHASKKARYTNYEKLKAVREQEQLTLLGKLLYGQERYDKI